MSNSTSNKNRTITNKLHAKLFKTSSKQSTDSPLLATKVKSDFSPLLPVKQSLDDENINS